MGEMNVQELSAGRLRVFMQKLLTDLRALERMIDLDLIETGVRRIGAEQEVFLVERSRAPSLKAMEILSGLDSHFTTELGRFNMELNLDPLDLTPDCLSRMETQLEDLLSQAREAAGRHGVDVLLIGILPTLEKSHLTLDNMSPRERYRALNDAMHRLRGSEFEFRIEGVDELAFQHDNVMVEACNTSFQVHFQVGAEEFPRLYNVAQAMAGPCLAPAVNSPLLFGRRLWRETRIALFQQSVDTRQPTQHAHEQRPRVSFGHQWVERSVIEIFQEDIARFRVLLGAEIDEDPFEVLEKGGIPRLQALRLHNGTVYRWNRPCYGISDGKPHLRIENRVLPSGPTPLDEVANAAFWLGLVTGGIEEYGDPAKVMAFEDAKENFLAAARLGLEARFHWPGRRQPIAAQELILRELLPLARSALLDHLSLDRDDVDRYLGVMEERVSSARTGAQWLLDSCAAMKDRGGRVERMAVLTAATLARQIEGRPVHEWTLAEPSETSGTSYRSPTGSRTPS